MPAASWLMNLGFAGSVTVVSIASPPYEVVATDNYQAGAFAAGAHQAGAVKADNHQAGAVAAEGQPT